MYYRMYSNMTWRCSFLWIVILSSSFSSLCDSFTPVHRMDSFRLRTALQSTPTKECDNGGGLYRSFAEQAWSYVLEQQPLLSVIEDLPPAVSYQETQVPPHNRTVRISLRAAAGSGGPIAYVRSALIETFNDDDDDEQGIQVLNMVIFPLSQSGWPVWGADFVSLPGNKHLLLLDAQPVQALDQEHNDTAFLRNWYERHEIATRYPWGGDLPEAVQEFVSPYALWTRLGGSVNGTTDHRMVPPTALIRQSVFSAALDHLSTYLQWLSAQCIVHDEGRGESRLPRYLQYRLDNDPARPMLRRLFGAEWTEQALHDVLFPMHLVLRSSNETTDTMKG